MRRFPPWPLLVLLCSYQFMASCGTNDNLLNTRKGEKVIGEWLEKQGMLADSITCPGDIKMAKGSSFLCQAVIADASGLSIDVRVHQTSGTGEIRLEHATKIVSAERVERGVAGQTLDQIGKKVNVLCGDRVRMAVVGKTFRCNVAEDTTGADRNAAKGAEFEVEITIKDTDGAWNARRL